MSRDRDQSPWSIFRGKLPLESETTWYVLLSVLDVVLTYLLLRQSANPEARVRLYESNPVARWVLNHYGMRGMIGFKFVLVAAVAVIAQVVATRRPEWARYLLYFACVAVGAVVVYSAYLLALATH